MARNKIIRFSKRDDRVLFILGTASQIPTRWRNTCATLFRWREHGFLFDAGEGVQRQLYRLGLGAGDIHTVLISHFHGDHVLGLPGLIQSISLQTENHTLRILYPGIHRKYFRHLIGGSIFQQGVKIVEEPVKSLGPQIRVGDITIEAYRLQHKVSTWGYVLQEDDKVKFDSLKIAEIGLANNPLLKKITLEHSVEFNGRTISYDMVGERRRGFRLGYIPDTRICNAIDKIAKNCDLLICEATYLADDSRIAYENYHLTAEQSAQIALQNNVKLLVLTHFSQRYQDRQNLFEEEAKKIFPNTIAAEDFMTLYL